MDNISRIVLVMVILGWTGVAWTQNQDGIAAIVDGQVITFTQVKRQVDASERLLRETYQGQELVDKIKEARLRALRALIEQQLIIQDFAKQGYFIPENIIEDRLKEIIQTQYEGDRTVLIRSLQAEGLSIEYYKKQLKDKIIVDAMRQKNVQSAVIVSPFKIEQYYQDNLRQFLQEDQVKVSLIFLRKGLFKEKRQNAKGQTEEFDPVEEAIKELHYKLQTGSKFSELSKSYSEGPNRDQGGDIGWVTKQTLRQELAEIAFKMRPGQLSGVITTADGYYVIRVEDFRRARVTPLADVRSEIEKSLIQEERQRLQQEWLDGLRSRYFIKMF